MFSRKIQILTLGLAAAALLAGCAGGSGLPLPFLASATPTITPTPPTPTPTPVPLALTVNDEGISKAEFEAELAGFKNSQAARGLAPTDAEARQAVVDELVAQTLLAQGARAAGFQDDDALLQQRLDNLAAQAGSADALAKWETDHGFTPDSFRDSLRRAVAAGWMRDHLAAQVASSTEQIHLQQILLYNEEAARQVLEQLQSGTDFNELAAVYDPNTRGDLGWIPRGYLLEPEVEKVAFTLQIGQISQVITSGVGWHIIKVLERDPNRALSPDALLALQAKTVADWVAQQRQQSAIVQNP